MKEKQSVTYVLVIIGLSISSLMALVLGDLKIESEETCAELQNTESEWSGSISKSSTIGESWELEDKCSFGGELVGEIEILRWSSWVVKYSARIWEPAWLVLELDDGPDGSAMVT